MEKIKNDLLMENKMTKIECFGCDKIIDSKIKNVYLFSLTQSFFCGGKEFISTLCEDCVGKLKWKKKFEDKFKE